MSSPQSSHFPAELGEPLRGISPLSKFRSRALKQRGLTGLCGPYAIVNALGCVLPLRLREADRRALARELAAALPVSFGMLMLEGTDRGQLIHMLRAAENIVPGNGVRRWEWIERHPSPGQTAAAFWAGLEGELAPAGTAAIVGFGDYHEPSGYYEPHWTCAESVAGRWLSCLDSDEYDRVRLADTGIRPEPGWEIEDCFIIRALDNA